MLAKVLNLIPLAFPVFNIDKFASVIPILPASSFDVIFFFLILDPDL
ncbi:conserved domain protein [Peptoniphilus sp. oral taxon 375 str. F0436]|nr:conserved domain protein [Peptoniphilus sp. oral taxon 375 str. F0436]